MGLVSELAIDVDDISFCYPGSTGVSFNGLSLKVNKGDRFGLFGPNGAGKTTLIGLMTGLLYANKGSIKLLGHDVERDATAAKKLFGFVPQDFSFYQELTPVENLDFFGAWSGLERKAIRYKTDELLTILGLNDVRNTPVHKFSGGMKRRVNLAIGVIHDPAIVFLDEPTVGVDVQTARAIVDYLISLNDSGTTLVYTSHQLNEAQDLCKHVALIDHGKLIAQNDLQELLKMHSLENLEELFLNLTGKEYRN